MDSGIYCFENKVNGKKYIGKSINVNQRINTHIRNLNKNEDSCTYLQNAWNKYKENNFSIYIIEECNKNDMIEREMFYIKELNTKSPNGYNLTDGGEGMLGYNPSDESRLKMGLSQQGRKHSQETKNKIVNWLVGHFVSKETKDKISKANFGRKQKASSSKYFGVSEYKARNCWRATIVIRENGKRKTIVISSIKKEIRNSEILVAKAYDKYVRENNLQRPLNFP